MTVRLAGLLGVVAVWALVACAGSSGSDAGCAPNGQQACSVGSGAGYQVCSAQGEWGACLPVASSTTAASAHPGTAQCSLTPGLYTEHAQAADVETFTSCRSEFSFTLDASHGTSIGLDTSGCDLGGTVTPDGCSRLCKYSVDGGGTAEETSTIASNTTLTGHLTVTTADGTRCEYDVATKKN